MRNHVSVFLIALTCLAMLAPKSAFASASTSTPSAISAELPALNQPVDIRGQVLRSYLLDKNSPLADKANVFIKAADNNHIDWRLLVAISGVESCFGIEIPYNSYNGWGYGIYGHNTRSFKSWDDAIDTISYDLRNKYMDTWHATTVDQIGHLYAAAPTWSIRVEHFMNEINSYDEHLAPATLPISL